MLIALSGIFCPFPTLFPEEQCSYAFRANSNNCISPNNFNNFTKSGCLRVHRTKKIQSYVCFTAVTVRIFRITNSNCCCLLNTWGSLFASMISFSKHVDWQKLIEAVNQNSSSEEENSITVIKTCITRSAYTQISKVISTFDYDKLMLFILFPVDTHTVAIRLPHDYRKSARIMQWV